MARPDTPPVDYEAIDGMMRDGNRKRMGNGNRCPFTPYS